MANDERVAEVVAKLDVLERDVANLPNRIRALKQELFDTLDGYEEPVLD